MMFKEIFDYHHEFNHRFIEEFEAHFDKLPERTYPLFCHVLNAHQIWNARILGLDCFGVGEIHQLETCKQINASNFTNSLKIVAEVDLESRIKYQNTRGKEFENRIADILFHVANHSTHHKGQIVSDFRLSGIEPIITDYIFYKR